MSDRDQPLHRQMLEQELAAILDRWQRPGYLERTPARVIDDERRRHDELEAQLAEYARADAARAVQGGLSSRSVGVWNPLVLYPTEQPAERGHLTAPRNLETLEHEVFQLLRTDDGKPKLQSLAKRWSDEPRARRLLAAALRSVGDAPGAKQLEPPPRAPSPRPWPAVSAQWLNQATEVADEFDGLTRTQRAALRFMREVASEFRPAVSLAQLSEALIASDPTADPQAFEQVVIGLGHPDLRPFPLVELRGLTGRFDPSATHFTHARLSPIGREVLDQTLALPMLLVNGAEGEGCWMPPHHPREVLSAALAVADPEVLWRVIDGVDLPTGVASESCRELWRDGFGVLTCTSVVELEVDEPSRRARLIVRRFPWPLRASQVAARVLQYRAAGQFDGVISVRDQPTADEERVVLELEHLAFAQDVKAALLRSKVGSMRFDVGLVVPDPAQTRRRTTFVDLLESFVEHRKERMVKTLDERVAAAVKQAQNAEAVCVALLMVEHVMKVMRVADDDQAAALALTQCFLPEHHALLERLRFQPSHGYERGFTHDQATHLLTVTKLASRTLDAAQAEWERRLSDVDASRKALSARANVLELVKEELQATMQRFDQPRRSPRWPHDA